MAELYRQLAADLLASEKPKKLSADELEQYDLLLEEQATPFEEQAIKMHEANTVHARDGIYDDGVRASFAALAKLLPGRYGKTEAVGTWTRSLVLVQKPLPAPEVVAPAAAAPAAPAAAAPLAPAAEPAPRLAAQFDSALKQAEAGQGTDAELEFKQLMEAAPELGGAAYNLGVQLRAAGRLEEAEQAFATAVARAPRSAMALTELGLTQRLRGNFKGAVESYTRALSVDPDYAPAHRNLGIVQDVYLGDPGAAIESFERYKALTGEDRPVTGWIADVRQRAGKAGATP
jgi:tetratricopeptide (TPR) repeat protein